MINIFILDNFTHIIACNYSPIAHNHFPNTTFTKNNNNLWR